MKRSCVTFIFGFMLLFQTTAAFAGQLPAALEQYKKTILSALTETQSEDERYYLRTCLTAADHLNGLEASDSRVSAAFTKLVQIRLDADGRLTPQTSGAAAVRSEQNAYNMHLQPYRKDEYLNLIRLQDQLLERKYFQTETAKNANFLEGMINSHWSLTRADHSDIKKVLAEPHLGVSPWEAIFRLEPAIAVQDAVQAAILATAGLSYAFFPDIDRSNLPASIHETFWSQWVRKSGGRIGVGVGNIGNHARLILGTGMQINAISLWGLYKPEGGTFMLGISACDLGKLKKVVSWFD